MMNILGYEITRKKKIKKIIFDIGSDGHVKVDIDGDWGSIESFEVYPKILEYYVSLGKKIPNLSITEKVEILKIFFGSEYTFVVTGKEIDWDPNDGDTWEGG